MDREPPDLLPATWHQLEFPVLRETARLLGEAPFGQGIRLPEITSATGLDDEATLRALKALEHEGLVEMRWRMPARGSRAVQISGDARREVGLWPTPQNGLERMITALEAIAENTDDEDTRTRARKILDGITGTGKHVGLAMATAYATGQIPGQ